MSRILLIEDNDSIILGLEYLFKEEKFEFEYVKHIQKVLLKNWALV